MDWTKKRVQELLDRGLFVQEADRLAAESGGWKDHLAARVSPPSFFALANPVDGFTHLRVGRLENLSLRRKLFALLFRRVSWNLAYRAAVEAGTGRKAVRFLIVPVWSLDNPDDEESGDWRESGLVLVDFDRDSCQLLDYKEISRFGPLPLIRGVVDDYELASVVESEAYHPDIPLRRFGEFATLESSRILVVREVGEVQSVTRIDRPTEVMPPFSSRILLAIDSAQLSVQEHNAASSWIATFNRPTPEPG